MLCLDFMFHQYGTSEDWNRYAAFTGDSGWAWANMRQYVQKVIIYVSELSARTELKLDFWNSTRPSFLLQDPTH